MSAPEYCIWCGAQALRDEDGEIMGWAVTIAMDPDCDHEFVSAKGVEW
jgi:hypothetical protein